MPNSHSPRIGVITVRGMDYHPTLRLAEAAAARGGRVTAIHPYHFFPTLTAGRPGLTGTPGAWDLDAVLPRQGAEIKDACLPLLEHSFRMGIPVINTLPGILRARNQFWTLQALSANNIPVPDTTFIPALDDPARLWDATAADTVVVKTVSGRQGKGMQRLERNGPPLDTSIAAALKDGSGLLVQTYLDPAGRTDIRALVVGGDVVGAMQLSPEPGDFRANFHLTGQATAVDITGPMRQLAVDAARAIGLEVAGVDIMVTADGRAFVGEVNYAPGFRGLEQATGKDIAGAIIDHVMARISGRRAIPRYSESGHR